MRFKQHFVTAVFFGFLTGFYFLLFGCAAYLASPYYRTSSAGDRLFVFKLQLFANMPLFVIVGIIVALLFSLLSRRFNFFKSKGGSFYLFFFSGLSIYLQFKLFSGSYVVSTLPRIVKLLLYPSAAVAVTLFLGLFYLLAKKRLADKDSGNRLLALEGMLAGLFLLMIVLGLVKPTASWSALSRPTQEGPNILLITVDTLRDDHLSYRGYSRRTSPNIDRLAAEGVVFENAYTAVPRTFPSLCSFMTGKYAHRHGARNNFHHALPDFNLTLAEILKKEGYLTGAVVTNLGLQAHRKLGQGFDYYLETDHQNFQALKVPALRLLDFVGLRYPLRSLWDDQAGRTRSEAQKFIERNRGKKFFLWVHFLDPHMDYNPPLEFAGVFDRGYEGRYRNHFQFGNIPAERMIFECPLDPREIRHAISLHDGEILHTDNEIGKFFGRLKEWGLYENTLIIFSADHGEGLGEHGYFFTHGDLIYNDCVHIPLLIRFPGGAAKREISAPVSSVDLMPTILDFLGLEPPEGLDGISLLPTIFGGAEPRRAIFGESGISILSSSNPRMKIAIKPQRPLGIPPAEWFPIWEEVFNRAKFRMMVEGDWKLIYTPDEGSGSFELYDLASDPAEKINLYEEKAEIAERMRGRLMSWVKGDTLRNAEAISYDREMISNLQSIGYLR
jgi:arylsulfatase A-like enzyme